MFDLTDFAREHFVAEPEKFAAQCEKLRLFLEETNKHINLTRITGKEEFDLKHAADSLLIVHFFPQLAKEALEVADLGCGAGFPTLILALAFPQLKLCAIDSTTKKLRFVEEAAALLGLHNVRTVHGRINELNRSADFRRNFDFVTARAVGDSCMLARDAKDFPRKNGLFCFYKTPAQAAEELPRLGAGWKTTETVELPGCGERLWVWKKKN